MVRKSTVPSIYVSSLSDYNAGRLHGAWIDLWEGIEADDLEAKIKDMLAASPLAVWSEPEDEDEEPELLQPEEWEISDIDGYPSTKYLTHDPETICAVAALIHQHDLGAVEGFIAHTGASCLAELDNFSDLYVGVYESETAFIESYFEETFKQYENVKLFGDWGELSRYIDAEQIANDAFINCFYSHEVAYDRVYVYNRQ